MTSGQVVKTKGVLRVKSRYGSSGCPLLSRSWLVIGERVADGLHLGRKESRLAERAWIPCFPNPDERVCFTSALTSASSNVTQHLARMVLACLPSECASDNLFTSPSNH